MCSELHHVLRPKNLLRAVQEKCRPVLETNYGNFGSRLLWLGDKFDFCLEPASSHRQLGDSIELILVDRVVTDAGSFRPRAALVMGDVELPILKLSGQTRADQAVHVPCKSSKTSSEISRQLP